MRINENNYVDKAEKVIKELAEESKQRNRGRVDMVTTSKLRNLLAMTADIYNQVLTWQSETLSDELNGRIEYLRIRFVYECGRDDSKRKVRNFVEKSEVLEILKEIKKSRIICSSADTWKHWLHFINIMAEKNNRRKLLCMQKLRFLETFM